MASAPTFTLTFKTIAQLTGLDQLMNSVQSGAQKIEAINTRLSTMGARVNQALGAIGLGLSISKLIELGDKSLEVGKQQAAFRDQVLGSKEGTQELVEELTRLNEELEQTTGTSKGTSRSIEQLLLRAGATADQVKKATHAIIEFAASSAGTVAPLELAATVARKLGGAADQNDISLGRLGIRAKDFNGAVTEMAARGGDAAEAMKRASGGMDDYNIAVHHAELAVGRFVNAIRVPFFTALAGSFGGAKTELNEFAKSTAKVGEAVVKAGENTTDWIEQFAIAAAVLGHTLGNVANVAKAVFYAVAAVEAAIVSLVGVASLTVLSGVEKVVGKAIDALAGLAKFAATTARTLSGGLINIDTAGIDNVAAQFQTKLSGASDAVRKKWADDITHFADKGEEALSKLQQAVNAMSKGGGGILSGELIANVKKQLQELRGSLSSVAPGSRVAAPGTDSAGNEKAATDALTQSKYQLAAAEQTYKTELAETKLLEDAGAITHDQANARNLQSQKDYIAELERTKAALPGLIAQLEAVGNTKGVAEARLEFQRLGIEILKTKGEMQDGTFFGQMRAQIRQLANEWSNVGKQVGGFLTQQFQNFATTAGNVIGQLIFRTGNWKQAIVQLGQSFVSSLATMLIQWILSRTIMSALNKAFGVADAAAAKGQAGAAAGAWSVAATAASIATEGVAAGTGLAAYLAAIGTAAASSVGLAGGFQGGGFTGHGPENQRAGDVHFEEVVIPAPRVRELGRDWLMNLAVGSLSQPGYQRGGVGGSRPGSAPAAAGLGGGDVTIINVNDWDTAVQIAMKKRKGRTIIVDTISDRKFEV